MTRLKACTAHAANTPPAISCPEAFELDEQAEHPVATATDVDGQSLDISYAPPFEKLGVGETEVVAMASDGLDIAQCSFKVTKRALLLALFRLGTHGAAHHVSGGAYAAAARPQPRTCSCFFGHPGSRP